MRRFTVAVLAALAGTAALTGCGSTVPTSGPVTVSAAATATPAGAPGTGGTPQGNGSTAPGAPAPGGTPECKTAQLSLSRGNNGGDHGGAGTGVAQLILTNNSPTSCVIQGYAGVSETVGANGDPVGAPADREETSLAKVVPVILDSGGSAQFLLFMVAPGNFGPSCDPQPTDHLRVYPPDNTDSLSMAWDNQICTGSIHLLRVRAVQPM